MAEPLFLLTPGCNDACFGSTGLVVSADSAREAGSLGDAIGSAVDAVVRAGLKITRVEIDPG